MQELGLCTARTLDIDSSQNTSIYAVVYSKGKLMLGLEYKGYLPNTIYRRVLRPKAGPMLSRI